MGLATKYVFFGCRYFARRIGGSLFGHTTCIYTFMDRTVIYKLVYKPLTIITPINYSYIDHKPTIVKPFFLAIERYPGMKFNLYLRRSTFA